MKCLLNVLLLTIFSVYFVDVAVSAPRRPLRQEVVVSPPPVSDDVTVNFKELPVLDLIRAVYGDILKVNFSIDPALASRVDPVSVILRDSSKKDVLAYMVSLLDGLGILVEDRKHYLLFKPRSANFGHDVFIYRPHYRTVSYLKELLSGLFPGGGFPKQSGSGSVVGGGNSASHPSAPMFS